MLDDCSYLHLDSPRLVNVFKIYRQAMTFMASLLLLIATQGIILSQEVALKSKYSYSTPALDAAQQLYRQRKYPEALAAFEAIIAEAEAQQNYEEVVYAMEKKALALRRLNRYDDAIATMDKAIVLAKDNLPEDHFLISKMYYTRGSTDHILRDYYDARAYMDTAQVYYENASTYDSTAHYRIMEYKYYAYQYSEGSADTLLKYLDRLVFLEKARKGSPNRVSNLLQGYPEIYMQKGDFELALAYAIQGVQYAKENRSQVSSRYYAEAQYELVKTLYLKKDFDKALEVGLKAMPLVESIPRQQMPEYYAFNNLIGLAYIQIGDYNTALSYLEKAASIPTDAASIFDREDQLEFKAKVLINLALCYNTLGQTKRGKNLLDKSLKEMTDLIAPPSPNLHNNYENLGDFYQANGQWSSALIAYDSALRNGLASYKESIDQFPDRDNLGSSFSYSDLRTLGKKARVMRNVGIQSDSSQKMLTGSLEYVQRTHELLMENRESFLATQGKLYLSENFKSLYETGLEVCFDLYSITGDRSYFDLARKFAKQSKAILFLEQSQEFDLVNNNILPQEIKESFFESKRRIEILESSFNDLIGNAMTSDSVIRLNEELLEARSESNGIKNDIDRELEKYSQDETSVVTRVSNAEELKVRSGNVVIEFFYGSRNIYVLAKSSSNVSFHKVELTDEIFKSIGNVVECVSKAPNIDSLSAGLKSFSTSSYLIYQSLLEPVLKGLQGDLNHLIVVPDEFLSQLPFEVLLQEEAMAGQGFKGLDYLIKDYSIQYHLSSQLIKEELTKPNAKKELLGIGYKEFTSSKIRSGYGSLPGTERELNFLKSSIKGNYLIGETGTKDDFLNLAREYDVLHLAVHGKSDQNKRYESSLVFNGGDQNILNTNDLYLAGLRARLAVLSACESGAGVMNTGEGTFSIARGFSLVGVPSIVMSLWKVNDRVTSDLMMDMYKGFINEGQPINEALRSSKLNYLDNSDEYSAHPYYWAAFLHLGENTELNPQNKINSYVIWAGAFAFLFLIAIAFWVLGKKRKRAN